MDSEVMGDYIFEFFGFYISYLFAFAIQVI